MTQFYLMLLHYVLNNTLFYFLLKIRLNLDSILLINFPNNCLRILINHSSPSIRGTYCVTPLIVFVGSNLYFLEQQVRLNLWLWNWQRGGKDQPGDSENPASICLAYLSLSSTTFFKCFYLNLQVELQEINPMWSWKLVSNLWQITFTTFRFLSTVFFMSCL